MLMFGETIKKIRKDKGILQKDLYQDLVSNTFATQFEQGNYRINADTFLELLNRLAVNSDEFQRIHTGVVQDDYTTLKYAIVDAINQADAALLQKLLYSLEDFKQIAQAQLIAALTRLNLARIQAHEIPMESPDRQQIIHFLTKIDSWTLSDMALFTNFTPFIPYDMLKVHSISIEKKLAAQSETTMLCYFYTNLIDRSFTEGDYRLVKSFSLKLKELCQSPDLLFFKLVAEVYLDITEILFEPTATAALERIETTLDFLAAHTDPRICAQLRSHLAQIL